jgi:N-acetyl-anhydromuramyl-L-alanine amidase AmpD
MAAVPTDWMPDARINGVILHWTGGANRPNARDRRSYHVLVDGDGELVRGVASIAANGVGSTLRPRASHTLDCNTGWVGVSLCGMLAAREFPFDAGLQPINRTQWVAAAEAVASLCARYRIAVTRETVLSHAEVQGTLGIRQRQKWDITRLPWDSSTVGALACGDAFRALVSRAIDAAGWLPTLTPTERPVLRAGASGRHVETLQAELARHGFAIAVDGRWGPITTRAVRSFQRARGLKADGVVGPATWRALGEA